MMMNGHSSESPYRLHVICDSPARLTCHLFTGGQTFSLECAIGPMSRLVREDRWGMSVKSSKVEISDAQVVARPKDANLRSFWFLSFNLEDQRVGASLLVLDTPPTGAEHAAVLRGSPINPPRSSVRGALTFNHPESQLSILGTRHLTERVSGGSISPFYEATLVQVYKPELPSRHVGKLATEGEVGDVCKPGAPKVPEHDAAIGDLAEIMAPQRRQPLTTPSDDIFEKNWTDADGEPTYAARKETARFTLMGRLLGLIPKWPRPAGYLPYLNSTGPLTATPIVLPPSSFGARHITHTNRPLGPAGSGSAVIHSTTGAGLRRTQQSGLYDAAPRDAVLGLRALLLAGRREVQGCRPSSRCPVGNRGGRVSGPPRAAPERLRSCSAEVMPTPRGAM